jgi:D-serine deaminase-like pyridoxal phosphate-dependent protein
VTPGPIPPLRLPAGLDTPALVIDLDVVEANAARMQAAMDTAGVALRPHAKTHKSVMLARLQLNAGARGITVGTTGEAEVMFRGGINDIFIAYPLWAVGSKADRLWDILDDVELRLRVGFDSIEGARRLREMMSSSARTLEVMLEVDPGNHRTGVPPERAGEIAAGAQALGLEVVGAFSHGGHSYAGPDKTAGAAADELGALTTAAAAMRAEGIEPRVLSAGSTPTALGIARAPVTEVRPGTYLLGDRTQVALGGSPPHGVAVAVAATVVSTSMPGQVVIDAGAKSLTKDIQPYLRGFGSLPAYPAAVIERLSDYHGVVRIPEGTRAPELGEVVAVAPNHVCPVVDLFDRFVATRAGETVGDPPVDARGRSG